MNVALLKIGNMRKIVYLPTFLMLVLIDIKPGSEGDSGSNYLQNPFLSIISGCSVARYRASMGCWRSSVQIRPPRLTIRSSRIHECLCDKKHIMKKSGHPD